jgi:hypothetical protein
MMKPVHDIIQRYHRWPGTHPGNASYSTDQPRGRVHGQIKKCTNSTRCLSWRAHRRCSTHTFHCPSARRRRHGPSRRTPHAELRQHLGPSARLLHSARAAARSPALRLHPLHPTPLVLLRTGRSAHAVGAVPLRPHRSACPPLLRPCCCTRAEPLRAARPTPICYACSAPSYTNRAAPRHREGAHGVGKRRGGHGRGRNRRIGGGGERNRRRKRREGEGMRGGGGEEGRCPRGKDKIKRKSERDEKRWSRCSGDTITQTYGLL